jgi:hypothetical protein
MSPTVLPSRICAVAIQIATYRSDDLGDHEWSGAVALGVVPRERQA